jgi:hypothetical protein
MNLITSSSDDQIIIYDCEKGTERRRLNRSDWLPNFIRIVPTVGTVCKSSCVGRLLSVFVWDSFLCEFLVEAFAEVSSCQRDQKVEAKHSGNLLKVTTGTGTGTHR